MGNKCAHEKGGACKHPDAPKEARCPEAHFGYCTKRTRRAKQDPRKAEGCPLCKGTRVWNGQTCPVCKPKIRSRR